jgi:hypothetical protein
MIKKLIICIIFLILASRCYALDVDKQMHLAGSAVVSAFTLMAVDVIKPEWPSYKKWIVAGSLAMIPGILKEVKDEIDYGGWDNKDLLADAAGAFGGSALMISITIKW